MKQQTEIVAIVAAAGVGSRMQAEHPKQYLKIDGKTILEHTVEHLLAHKAINKVVVVISAEDEYFADTSLANLADVTFAFGGKERADSVLAGLEATDAEWIMVHDAARPCVRHQDIDSLIEAALVAKDGAILAMPARDTIKQAQGDKIAFTLDRATIWQALTPQMFKRQQLITAYKHAKAQHIMLTDDASAVEWMGGTPCLVRGHADNIKITHPEDLALAAFFLNQKEAI